MVEVWRSHPIQNYKMKLWTENLSLCILHSNSFASRFIFLAQHFDAKSEIRMIRRSEQAHSRNWIQGAIVAPLSQCWGGKRGNQALRKASWESTQKGGTQLQRHLALLHRTLLVMEQSTTPPPASCPSYRLPMMVLGMWAFSGQAYGENHLQACMGVEHEILEHHLFKTVP